MFSRLGRATAVTLATVLLAGGLAGGVGAAPAPATVTSSGLYVVALDDVPATASRKALREARRAVLEEVGRPTVRYEYDTALNGFAADLDREQVKQLRAHPDVALVERSSLHRTDSVDSPDFLGATQAWASTGGPEQAGRGTVVAVVDSGIWPENPSFAALPEPPRSREAHTGSCEKAEQWAEADCNSKVVSAQHFVAGFGEENLAASELLSPRDRTGHGSHVAAIAAGNSGVRLSVDGQQFGAASGMAPAAQLAVYKVCWTAPDPADDGCSTADVVAAVDQALADGVDVIGYALSSPDGQPSRAVELAFLNATAAGVFVATSAGNRGPGTGTVAHTAPWVTTVAASTHHTFQGSVVLGDGSEHVGAMVADRSVAATGIVLAGDAALHGASRARLCVPGTLDAAEVQGKIVVCDRGTVARVQKSSAVALAGGVGMVLANVRPEGVDPDFHDVPTVHLDVAAAEAVKRYVEQTEDPTAALDATGSDDTEVPQVAPFSARGPGPEDRQAVLKPDLAAPGVAVLAATAPPAAEGRLWDQRSGTSMSAAHVAGLAAFVKGARRSWTPAMVKSAMSTTADELEGVSGPLAVGAGQVDAAEVLDPGLVLDTPVRAFRRWLAGELPTGRLNLPSIAVPDLTGRGRVVRRVTNVTGNTETYSAQVRGLDGIDVSVRPSTLTLGPGETGRFAVVLERRDAQLEAPARGELVWTGLSHQARLPLVVTPRTVAVPDVAHGSGEEGTVSFRGTAGTDGELDLHVSGLAAARPVGLTLEPGDFDPAARVVDRDTGRFPVEVPQGAELLRFEVEGRDSDDLDLYLYRDGALVAAATGSQADETLTLVDPASGDYELFVASTLAANDATTTAQLYTWVVQDGAARNLTAPASVPVRSGEPFGVELSWQGLDPTARWFGAVRYGSSDQLTFVRVN